MYAEELRDEAIVFVTSSPWIAPKPSHEAIVAAH
jgi:hypothetical protein